MRVRDLDAALSEPGALSQAVPWTTAKVRAGDGQLVTTVTTKPAELARQARVGLETFSLATCIASEGYGDARNDPETTRRGRAAAAVGMAYVVVREALAREKSITGMLTAGAFTTAPAGQYGAQRGRYASTARPPTRWHLQVAAAVLAGEVTDVSRGARHFLDPAVFRGGVQDGLPLGELGDTLTRWMIKGRQDWVGQVPTIDPYYLVFIGPGGTDETRQANRRRLLDIMLAGPQGPAPGDPDADGGGFDAGTVLALVAMGLGAYLAAQLYMETFA